MEYEGICDRHTSKRELRRDFVRATVTTLRRAGDLGLKEPYVLGLWYDYPTSTNDIVVCSDTRGTYIIWLCTRYTNGTEISGE